MKEKEDEFEKIGKLQSKVFTDAMVQVSEFKKLDEIDRKILGWKVWRRPSTVIDWIDYLKAEYSKRSILINKKKLHRQVIRFTKAMKYYERN